jgi:hypothetical protein
MNEKSKPAIVSLAAVWAYIRFKLSGSSSSPSRKTPGTVQEFRSPFGEAVCDRAQPTAASKIASPT